MHSSTQVHETLRWLLTSIRLVINKADKESLTPLHWAVLCGHVEHLLLLLQNQADPHAVDSEGRTVLHYSVSANAVDSLQVCADIHLGLKRNN